MRNRLSVALWVGVALCCVALVGESVYRAAAFPITHDEGLSYAIYGWDHSWADTPNNHILNTQLMRLCARLFGTSELSLRLPNLVAEVFYLGAILMLLSRVRRALFVPAFAVLTLNLFQFDYFAMARGYGLELGCIAASLLFFVRAVDAKAGGTPSLPWFGCSLMAGVGSTLANFSAFYLYVPLCALSGWLMVTDESHARPRRGGWLPVAALLGTAGLWSLVVIGWASRKQQAHMLYEGGATGFFSDTVVTLVRGSFFAPPYDDHVVRAVALTVVILVGLFATLAAWSAWRARQFVTVPVLLGTMLAIAVLLPMAQHALTDFLLPTGRYALYYVPLGWLMVIFAADAGVTSLRRWRLANVIPLWIVATAVAGLVGASFSPFHTYNGFTDTHIKEVLATLDADRQIAFPGEQIALANTWDLEPLLNFYRVTRHLAWLKPATRDPVEVGNNQYIYAIGRDLTRLQAVPHTELASFPDSGTALWRVRRPADK
jgi:hypothetical protein